MHDKTSTIIIYCTVFRSCLLPLIIDVNIDLFARSIWTNNLKVWIQNKKNGWWLLENIGMSPNTHRNIKKQQKETHGTCNKVQCTISCNIKLHNPPFIVSLSFCFKSNRLRPVRGPTKLSMDFKQYLIIHDMKALCKSLERLR